MDRVKVDRRCSYSLSLISAESVKCCSKCHKRAYCSPQCQAKDWTKTLDEDGETSQGHKNWCGLDYGEEDLDWAVVSVPFKGEGIIAKRYFPKYSRIIVEGNNADGEYDGRIFKANHSCAPNAVRRIDPEFGVVVLIAKQEIRPGEEICVTYLSFVTYKGTHYGKSIDSLEDRQQVLYEKFNVICPTDCICRDEEVRLLVEEYLELAETVKNANENNSCPTTAIKDLETIKKLLEINIKIEETMLDRAQLWELGFVIGIKQFDTMEFADTCARESYNFWSRVLHPKSKKLAEYKKRMDEPRSYNSYGRIELAQFECKD